MSMADPVKSQKKLEDESHGLIEGHPYLKEVTDVHMLAVSNESSGCDNDPALKLSAECSDSDYQHMMLDDVSIKHECLSSGEDDETVVSVKQQKETTQFLRDWAIKSKISAEALNSLLSHLNTFMPLLPKTGVALMETEHIKGVVRTM